MYGSGAYGQSAYASTVRPTSIFISTSVSPGGYNYSSIFTLSSGIEIVEPANYSYNGVQILGVGEAVVENGNYIYIGTKTINLGIEIVNPSNYEYSGMQGISSVYPYPDTIIIVHNYNSEIIEVS